KKTRLMVSSEVPAAAISLDGAPAVRSPLIAEVTPGAHAVRITAEGYFTSERSVTAVAGELVPLEIALREQPSILRLRAPEDVDLYVDGAFVGKAGTAQRLELPSGAHVFSFAKDGHRIETVRAELGRGEQREVSGSLRWSGQRLAAVVLFAASGAGVVTG